MRGDCLTEPPQERGSVRPVTVEGDDRVYNFEVLTLPGQGLRDGAFV